MCFPNAVVHCPHVKNEECVTMQSPSSGLHIPSPTSSSLGVRVCPLSGSGSGRQAGHEDSTASIMFRGIWLSLYPQWVIFHESSATTYNYIPIVDPEKIHLNAAWFKTINKMVFDVVLGDNVSCRALHGSLDDLNVSIDSGMSLCLGKCPPLHLLFNMTSVKIYDLLWLMFIIQCKAESSPRFTLLRNVTILTIPSASTLLIKPSFPRNDLWMVTHTKSLIQSWSWSSMLVWYNWRQCLGVLTMYQPVPW